MCLYIIQSSQPAVLQCMSRVSGEARSLLSVKGLCSSQGRDGTPTGGGYCVEL